MKLLKYLVPAILLVTSLSAANNPKSGAAPRAKTYVLQLSEDVKAGNVALHQGRYEVTVEQTKIILTPKGKTERFEIPATISTVDKKFHTTKLSMKAENGATLLKQIDLGGTKTKIEIQ
ncbi:MAG: hypothetical protein IT168_10410 [Bryobacterales bacterium]|nr:hypothetical protein [Bryobacterales bacterium]